MKHCLTVIQFENPNRTVTDVFQYEDDPNDDTVKVHTAKLPHRLKALKLALCYVKQQLTAS